MGLFSSLGSSLQTVFGIRPRKVPQNATPENRPYGHSGTNLTTDQAWKTLKLRKRRLTVDPEGRWWLIEERQCLYTGLILRRTRRITD